MSQMRDVKLPIGPIGDDNIAIRLVFIGDSIDLLLRWKNILDDPITLSETVRVRNCGRLANSLCFESIAKR